MTQPVAVAPTFSTDPTHLWKWVGSAHCRRALCPIPNGHGVGPATTEFQKLVNYGTVRLRNHFRGSSCATGVREVCTGDRARSRLQFQGRLGVVGGQGESMITGPIGVLWALTTWTSVESESVWEISVGSPCELAVIFAGDARGRIR